jgi:hypothetical protein
MDRRPRHISIVNRHVPSHDRQPRALIRRRPCAAALPGGVTVRHVTQPRTGGDRQTCESGHRVTWQRLHEALAGTGTGTVGWSLDDLADALAVARDVLA